MHGEGAYFVDAAQPFRPFVLEMLDPPDYPMVRETSEGEVIRPYDVTAWALPALLGLQVQALTLRPEGLGAQAVVRPRSALPERPPGPVALPATDNASYAAAMRLLARGGKVQRFVAGERAGEFLVPDGAAADPVLLATGARPRPAGTAEGAVDLLLPRVVLYEPHGGSTDGGWTRLLLDRVGLAHQSMGPGDLAGLARHSDGAARLLRQADVLIIPSISPEELRRGRMPDEPTDVWSPRWPEAYRGGLLGGGAVGLLLDFVKQGGHLVCLGESSAWAVEDLGLPAAMTPGEGLSRDEFYVPGTLLRARVDPTQPLAWGMPEEVPVYAAHGQAFATRAWTRPTGVPVLYAREDLRVAGFLNGAGRLAGRPALVDIPLGEGRVVLFGFSPQHRCQTEATFKLLFNALLRAGGGEPSHGDS